MSILGPHAGAGILLNLALQFCQIDSYAWRVWVAVAFGYSRFLRLDLKNLVIQPPWASSAPDIVHPINYISAAGLATLLAVLLRKPHADIDTIPLTIPGLASPLYAPAANGHHRTFDLLLTAGADPNRKPGGFYGTALQAASAFGYLSVVRCLLDAGAEINAQSGYYGDALQAASRSGFPELVRLLLDEGANVNAQGGLFGNALQAACDEGTIESVKLLLQNGADVNAQGGRWRHALQAAAYNGHENVVQLLLDNGAHVKDSEGNFIISLDGIPGTNELELIQLLLKYGAIEEPPPSASVSRRTSLDSDTSSVSELRRLVG
jgi:ankyrin repeat protein